MSDITRKSIYNIYIATIYRFGMLTFACSCMSAAVFYTVMKLFGQYPMVSWSVLVIFDLMDTVFVSIAFLLIRTSVHHGMIKPGRILLGKCFAAFVVVIQWNYILYMVPSGTFWGFLFFFIIVICFFLDLKLILFSGCACILSLYIFYQRTGKTPFYIADSLVREDSIVLALSMLFSLTGIVIFVLFMKHIQSLSARLEQRLKLQKKYYGELSRKNDGLRRFRHDVYKHLQALYAMCEMEQYDSVKGYIEELTDTLEQNGIVHTGNAIADSFLNDLFESMEGDAHFHWRVTGTFPEKLPVGDVDFCIMIANALENAKEALALASGEKQFYFGIRNYKGRLYITIKNTCSSEGVVTKMGFVTHKADKESHGLGLSSIRMTVSKYNGQAEWFCQDGMFQIEIKI